MNSEIANKVITLLRNVAPQKDEDDVIKLNDRESDILNGISKGKGYKSIAGELFISIETVRYHIKNIYKKLHVSSQSEAVATAIKRGLEGAHFFAYGLGHYWRDGTHIPGQTDVWHEFKTLPESAIEKMERERKKF